MGWVRIDDAFALHPKLLAAGPYGLAMMVAGLCYCNRYLTNGFVPDRAIRSLLDLPETELHACGDCGAVTYGDVARALVAAGLWRRVDGGFVIHDYADYQPSKEAVLAEKESRQNAQRRGGTVRATNAQRDPEGRFVSAGQSS